MRRLTATHIKNQKWTLNKDQPSTTSLKQLLPHKTSKKKILEIAQETKATPEVIHSIHQLLYEKTSLGKFARDSGTWTNKELVTSYVKLQDARMEKYYGTTGTEEEARKTALASILILEAIRRNLVPSKA